MDSEDFDWAPVMDRFADRYPWVVTRGDQGIADFHVHMGEPGTLHDDLLADQMIDPDDVVARGEYHPDEGVTTFAPLGNEYNDIVEDYLEDQGHHTAAIEDNTLVSDVDWIPGGDDAVGTSFENRRPWAVNFTNPADPKVYIGELGDYHPNNVWGHEWVKGGIQEYGPQYQIWSYSGNPLLEQAKALVERQYTQTQHEPPEQKTSAVSDEELRVRAQQAVKAMQAGGFTLTADLLPADTERYVVSISGSELLISMDVFNADDILAYRHQHIGELMVGNFLGGWLDKGTAYLDLSQSFANKDAAFTFGIENGQQAIYDSVTEEVLPVPRVGATQKMYHSAPSSARESILEHGLDHRVHFGDEPVPEDTEDVAWAPRANYLAEHPNYTHAAIGGSFLPEHDLWEVDVSDLPLEPDEAWYKGWRALEPITPDRLHLRGTSKTSSADNWSTFENQETHSVDPTGDAPGLQPEMPKCIKCGNPVNSDRDKLCIECQSAGDKFVPRVTQPLKYFAANPDFWVYLDGKVGFGEHPWEIARQLAGALGYDKTKAEYLSNTIAANAVPQDIPCAIGQMLGGRPQIWASTVDRNWVWDEVMRTKQLMATA